MGLFDSITDLVGSVAKVVAAPVEVVVNVANAVVEPLAEAAEEIIKDVKSLND